MHLFLTRIPWCLGSITADLFSGIWEVSSSPEAIMDIKRAAACTPPSLGPFQHHCIKLNLIWHLWSLHKYFIFIWKSVPHCFALHKPVLFEWEQRRYHYSIIQPDYLCPGLWNRFVFVCRFFWSDHSLWKASFMALASPRVRLHLSTHTAMSQLCSAQTGCAGVFYICIIWTLFMLDELCCFSGH